MDEKQADSLIKELKIIRICVVIVTAGLVFGYVSAILGMLFK